MLLDTAKKLIGVEFLLAGSGAAQNSHVKDNHIAAAWLHAIEYVPEMVHIEVVAHWHQNISWTCSHGFGS